MRAQMRHHAMPIAQDPPDGDIVAVRAGATRQTSVGQLSLTTHHELASLEPAWRALEADPWNSLHQTFAWCEAWVKAHGNGVVILEGRLNGDLAFLLPLEVERHLMVRAARLICSPFTNFNSGLFSSEFRKIAATIPADDLEALLVDALRDHADLLSLTHIPLEWRGERHPLAALPHIRNQNSSFQLSLGLTMEETIAPLNAKSRRKKYRGQVRKLEAAGGFEHLCPQSIADQRALLECFFHQKAVRFAALGLPNVFQPLETQTFFHMLLDIDASDCSGIPLELHAIRLKGEHDGKIAAIAGLSRKGDHVICQFGSIDDSLMAEASPGELLFWLVIERSALAGAALFDFGIGDQDYKRRWCNIETVHHDILLPLGPAGHLAAASHRGITRAKTLIKGNPHLYALIQRWRAKGQSAQPSKSED